MTTKFSLIGRRKFIFRLQWFSKSVNCWHYGGLVIINYECRPQLVSELITVLSFQPNCHFEVSGWHLLASVNFDNLCVVSEKRWEIIFWPESNALAHKSDLIYHYFSLWPLLCSWWWGGDGKEKRNNFWRWNWTLLGLCGFFCFFLLSSSMWC